MPQAIAISLILFGVELSGGCLSGLVSESSLDRAQGRLPSGETETRLWYSVVANTAIQQESESQARSTPGVQFAPRRGGVATANPHHYGVSGARRLAPRSFGFDLDPDQTHTADNQNAAVRLASGAQAIAKIYCRVGPDHSILLMPDGKLQAYDNRDLQLTDEEFKPMRHLDVAKSLQQGELVDFRVKTTKHYVFVYNTTESFVSVTSRILESMRHGVTTKLQREGFELEKPPVPLVVIMFRAQAEFQRYRKMPAGIVAYYNMVSNQVVLYEPAIGPNSRRDLVQGQALSTIAHEGAHQLLHNIGIQQRLSLWPMWLSEGLAEYLAPTSFGKRLRWKGAGDINDLRMFELENYLQQSELRGLDGSTIRDSVGAPRLNSTGYATAWALVHYLAAHRKQELLDYIRYISQLEPLTGMASHGDRVEANLQHFREFFDDDLAAEEKSFIQHLKQQDYDSPLANYPHYVTVVSYQQAGQTVVKGCIFHRQSLTENWLNQFLNSLEPAEQATSRHVSQSFPNRVTALRFLTQVVDP